MTTRHRPHAAVRAAYRECRRIARAHYENFPVASWLLPARLRGPVAAIYVFARRADDLADEGRHGERWEQREARRATLHALAQKLDALDDPRAESEPLWIALADAIQRFDLPRAPFHNLLSAFEQDLDTTRYATFGDVIDYCRRSANPVGRLLLHLNGSADAERLALSDAICTALQLLNFYQDLAQDLTENDRLYLPADEMARFGVTESMLRARRDTPGLRQLLQHSVDRADRLLRAGAPLGRKLPGRFGLEIRAIVAGGARIAWRLKRREDPYARPRLDTRDRLAIVKNALLG